MRGTSPSKKPRKRCARKYVQKCTNSCFVGVSKLCTQKNVPRGKDSTSWNPPLYIVLKAAFSAHRVFFLFFETNATLRVLKTKKAQFQFKFIPHFVNAPSKIFVILKIFSCKSIKFTPSALSHKSTSTELVSMAGCVWFLFFIKTGAAAIFS